MVNDVKSLAGDPSMQYDPIDVLDKLIFFILFQGNLLRFLIVKD